MEYLSNDILYIFVTYILSKILLKKTSYSHSLSIVPGRRCIQKKVCISPYLGQTRRVVDNKIQNLQITLSVDDLKSGGRFPIIQYSNNSVFSAAHRFENFSHDQLVLTQKKLTLKCLHQLTFNGQQWITLENSCFSLTQVQSYVHAIHRKPNQRNQHINDGFS